MTDAELMELAIKITKANQNYFWAPERQGERMKITRTFNILKDVGYFGHMIMRSDFKEQQP